MSKPTRVEICKNCHATTKIIFDDGYVDDRPPTHHHHACPDWDPIQVTVAELCRLVEERAAEGWEKQFSDLKTDEAAMEAAKDRGYV